MDMRDKGGNYQNRPFADPLELLPKALTKLYTIWVRLAYPFASKGRNLSFHFSSQCDRKRAARISLGNRVMIGKDAWLNVATEDPTGPPVIVLDDSCSIGYGTLISAKNRVHVERQVLVGQQVVIQDHSHVYEDITTPVASQGISGGGKIRIGQGSWIGRGAAILCSRGELTIGRNCVVGVNSVVMQSIPDYSVVFGSPAKIIRQYDPVNRRWRLGPVGRSTKRIDEVPSVLLKEP